MLYELLTGRLPLGRFAPPSAEAGLDPRLDDVVFRALEREPERRYQQASELQADLKAIHVARTIATAGGADARRANVLLAPRPSKATAPPLPPCDANLKRQIIHYANGLLAAAVAVYASVLWLVEGLVTSRNFIQTAVQLNGGRELLWLLLLFQVVVGSLLIVAGLKVRALEGYWLGIVASLLAILPIGPSWLVSLPLGLWCFLGLRKEEVRAAFGVPTIWHPLKWPGWLIGMLATLACVIWIAVGIGSIVFANLNRSHSFERTHTAIAGFFASAAMIEAPLALLMCVGAFRMKAYRSRRLALATAILALVPIGPTLFYGMPLGLWALVLLRRADVVAAFANRAAGGAPISASADPAQLARATTVPP